jgi:NitT/TauT family transport system substrate-binding protein
MDRKRFGTSIAVLAGILALAAGGCGGREQVQSKPGPTKVTICQWGQALIYLPLYIAQEKNYFSDAGLKVNLTSGGADDLTWSAVASGNADFGIADPTMVAIQNEKGGVPGRVIGTIVGGVSLWGVTLDAKVPNLATPADFKGRKIAVFRYPNTANALMKRTLLKAGLVEGKDVDLVEVNYGAVLAQLKGGEADVAMVLEPAASEIQVGQGGRIVYSYPGEWGPFTFTGLTTTEKTIKERPELVRAVVGALERAVRFAHSDFEGAVAVGKKAFPDLSDAVIRAAVRRMLDEKTLPEHIGVPEDAWNAAIQLCVDVGKLKATRAYGLDVDNSFAQVASTAP